MNEACMEVRELAPEVALGAISGPERARVLDHLETCVECRLFVDELSEAADSLLVLSPEAEPPLGFESTVLAQMRLGTKWSTRRWAALVAAAVILASAATWGGYHVATRPDRITQQYIATLKALGGQSLRAARLAAPDGTKAGEAMLYEGHPSWVFVSVERTSGTGVYDITAQLADRTTIRIGRVRVNEGRGSWGGTTAIAVESIRTLSIGDPSGGESFRARFDRIE